MDMPGMGTGGKPDPKLTQEDVSMLGKAMKKKKFRGLMQEYVDEISDPANRDEYDTYIQELEDKREMPAGMELLRPEPGMCLLTHIRFSSGQRQRVYINICHSQHVQPVDSSSSGPGGENCSLPFTMGPPRPDRDEGEGNCLTVDFCISTMTLSRCHQNPNMIKMLCDVACEHIETNFLKGNEEVIKDFKIQDFPCKGGKPMPLSVKEGTIKRDRATEKKKKKKKATPGEGVVTPSELRQMKKDARKAQGLDEETGKEIESESEEEIEEEEVAPTRIRIPKHRLIHSGTIELGGFTQGPDGTQAPVHREIPKELKLIVELPTVKRVQECDLEVSETNVVLEVADKYYFDFPLPYEIDASKAVAKFDKNKKPSELMLILPVVAIMPDKETLDFSWEDAGAQVDGDALEEEDDELPELEDAEEKKEEVEPTDEDKEKNDALDEVAEALEKVKAEDSPKREKLGEDYDDDEVRSPTRPTTAGSLVEEVGGEDFIPAQKFSGPRLGYVFKTGEEGLGYYRDAGGYAEPVEKPKMPEEPALIERLVKRSKPKEVVKVEAPEVDMGEPEQATEGENATRVWSVLRVDGDLEKASVKVRVRASQVRCSFVAILDGQRHGYEWRRALAGDVDTRQVRWDLSGRGGKELVVCLRKDVFGAWGSDKFTAIPESASANDEWNDDDENKENENKSDETGHELIAVIDKADQKLPTFGKPAEDATADISGDALLGQALTLKTRLFLEIF